MEIITIEKCEGVIVSERKRSIVFLNLIITAFSAMLLSTAMVVALPRIAEDMHVSLTVGQWVTSGFTLVSALIMPLSAYMITKIPTKRLYLGSILAVLVGLGISTIAQNLSAMMVGRVLQAAFGGILSAMAQVILMRIYPREKIGSVMGWYGLAMGFAPIIAPAIAGILMDLFTWRSIFVAAACVMLLSFMVALVVFDDFLPTKTQKFDSISFVLSALFFGGITLGVGNASNIGLINPFTYVPLLVGIVTSVFFVKRQLQLAEPLLELRLLKNRTFMLAVISSSLHNFIFMGTGILMPTFAQVVHGYTATQTGFFMLIPTSFFALVSPIAGKIYDKLGIRNLYIFSGAGMLLSSLLMTIITESTSLLLVCVPYIMRNISLGVLMMPLTTWGLSALEQSQTAQGTAVLNSFKNTAAAIGSAVVIGVMNTVTKLTASSPHADMYGFNGAFAFVSVFSLAMLIIAIFFVKPRKQTIDTQ